MSPATVTKLPTLKEQMPLLARHEGVWEGVYRYYDDAGNKIDEHKSQLVCRFPDAGPCPYQQTNFYTWADGRTETREFPGHLRNGRLEWDNELIKGWAADIALDHNARTTMLYWVRKDDPEMYLYEMIHLSDCGNFRSRIWQWIKGGKILRRTLIDETCISHDLRNLQN